MATPLPKIWRARDAGCGSPTRFLEPAEYAEKGQLPTEHRVPSLQALITSNPAELSSVGKHAPNIPDTMFSGQFLGHYRKWTGSLTGRYAGRMFSENDNSDVVKGVPGAYDPYFLFGASAGYQINSHVQAFVVFSISGIYRDGISDKVLLLNRAARMAVAAGDNAISRHDREVTASLRKNGVDAETASKKARARVFGNKPGQYGVGLDKMAEQSKDAGNTKGLADVYFHYMSFAFSGEV